MQENPVKAWGGAAWMGTLDEHSCCSTCGLTHEEEEFPEIPYAANILSQEEKK